MVAAHAHDIEAGQKHELQEQHFVNGQGPGEGDSRGKVIVGSECLGS